MDYRAVAKMLGSLLLGVALFMLLSAGISAIYSEWLGVYSLAGAALITIALGGLFYYYGRSARQNFFAREAVAMVVSDVRMTARRRSFAAPMAADNVVYRKSLEKSFLLFPLLST